WDGAAAAWEALAKEATLPAWGSVYLRRAAELWDARVGDGGRAERLYEQLHTGDPSDEVIALALVRLQFAHGGVARAAETMAGHARAGGGIAAQILAAQAAE